MYPDNKIALARNATAASDLITGLCDNYYHHLKNKEAFSKLLFDERISVAHEIISEAREHEIYFYRRAINGCLEKNEYQKKRVYADNPVNLASNDYLGLTKHPAVINAGREAIRLYGAASGSVPMLSGTTQLHKELEAALADFTGHESSLSFSSCTAANYGLLTALMTFSDAAILDLYIHGSVIDGCCNTNKIFFRHNDPDSLRKGLEKASGYKNKLVIVDGVYSMDGDIVLLEEISAMAKEYDAWLMVDESHALGVIGENGKGTQSHFNTEGKVDVITGSLGKGLGGVGGFVAGSEALISLLELTSRPFLFSTSLPQNIAAQLVKAMELMQSDVSLLRKLWDNIRLFSDGLKSMGFRNCDAECAILPLVISDEGQLLNFCQQLQSDGVFVNPIFFPIVPRRMSRIRISITAALSTEDLEYALDRIETAGRMLDII